MSFTKKSVKTRIPKDMPKEEIDELRQAFWEFDRDRSGTIDGKELINVMRSLGLNPTDLQVVELIDSVDTDGSGTIDFPEFVQLMTHQLKDTAAAYSEEMLSEALRVFDRDGLGYVSAHELRHLLTHIGDRMTNREVDELLKLADVDSDGQFNYHDFVRVLAGYCQQQSKKKVVRF
ncbi:calmodulin-like [Branchiostoma lanceolatum]|uniref:CALM1 protein n=1 Tax=Branchiostoma lanceolatum TaxID=7740 RepID=A0A8K0ENS4_BRALA|nr:CALM1 [Branchiostoma lanceolatum]